MAFLNTFCTAKIESREKLLGRKSLLKIKKSTLSFLESGFLMTYSVLYYRHIQGKT